MGCNRIIGNGQRCGGVMFEKENNSDFILLQCVRCGDEIRIFRNRYAIEGYEEQLKKDKEEVLRKQKLKEREITLEQIRFRGGEGGFGKGNLSDIFNNLRKQVNKNGY